MLKKQIPINKATDSVNPAVFAETGDIMISSRVRQYTPNFGNTSVNNYDTNITTQVNYWTDWHLGSPTYTFLPGAQPDADLVKAVAYQESTFQITPNLMQVTQNPALNSMTTGTGNSAERDPNAGAPKDSNGCTSVASGGPRMNYGTPTVTTVDDSFKWGIRWLIAKHSIFQIPSTGPCAGRISSMSNLSWESALNKYNTVRSSYGAEVLALYNTGKNPHPGNPTYLWPIKADGCPR